MDAADAILREASGDGVTLRYLDWGDPAAPPLVMLHGIRDQARAFDTVARALARRRRVIALDLRGHGDSDWSPDGAYLLPFHVADLVEFVDALGYPRFDLLGHSFGGSVASRYAGLFPERIEKLILIDGFGPAAANYAQWDAEGPVARTREWLDKRRQAKSRAARPIATIEDGMARLGKANARLSEAQQRHLAEHGLKGVDGGYAWKFDPRVGIFAPEDFGFRITSYWQAITAPALLCFGAESWSALKPGDERLAAMPHARIEAIADAGHWPHHDQPEAFVRIVEAFLG